MTLQTQNTLDVEVFNPLQNLYAQYKEDREGVERFAKAMDKKTLDYFFEAARVGNYRTSVNAADVFRLDPAIKAIDAQYWQTAMHLTDVLEYMPTEKRNDWHNQIHEHKTPEFTLETVKATLTDMLANRERFNAERVDGLFRALSGDHVTNRPQGFSKRMIIAYMYSYGSVSYERAGYIHDLRLVIAKLMGRTDSANLIGTSNDLNAIPRNGEWHNFDGGAFRVRCYKIGTIHFEVHPEIAWQLNKILAFLNPAAIPAEFRTKPKKKLKEHKLSYDLISFEVLKDMDELRRKQGENVLWWPGKILPKTEEVLTYLGGVKYGKEYHFDYDIINVMKEVRRTGAIPERKSHQYYPTPENVAIDAVECAGIGPEDYILEPSAGQGHIAKFIKKGMLTCIEISEIHCEILNTVLKNVNVICHDFLKWNEIKIFNRIIMNPPFSDGRAADHVRHASTLLADHGILVAILPASFRNKTIIEGMKHEWSEVYENEFQGCSVNVVILRMNR